MPQLGTKLLSTHRAGGCDAGNAHSWREGNIGPVLPVAGGSTQTMKSGAVANDSEFGLAACVWDPRRTPRGETAGARIQCGTVMVNELWFPCFGISEAAARRASKQGRHWPRPRPFWIGRDGPG